LFQLQEVIRQRATEPAGASPASYTRQLLDAGLPRMAQKVGEEGVETALAAVTGSDSELTGDSGFSSQRILKDHIGRHKMFWHL